MAVYDNESEDPIQDQYDEQLGQVADAEREAGSGNPNVNDGGGFFNDEDGGSFGRGNSDKGDTNSGSSGKNAPIDGNSNAASTGKGGKGNGDEESGGGLASKLMDDAVASTPLGAFGKAQKLLLGSKGRRRTTASLGIGGGLLGLAFAGFLFFSAQRIETAVENVNQEYGAASSEAVDQAEQSFFKQWVRKDIAPNLNKGTCHSTIDAGCVSEDRGTGPVTHLYNAWRNDHLEQKLASRYNLSLGYRNGEYYINNDGKIINFGKDAADVFNDESTTSGQRHEIETILSARLKEGTKWDKVYYRFKIAPLLKEKYGIRYCTTACKPVNKVVDNVKVRDRAAKAYLTQRTLTVLGESNSLLIGCIIDGGCKSDLENAAPGETTKTSANSKLLQRNLAKAAAANGAESLATTLEKANQISKDGFQKYIAKQLASTVASRLSSSATAGATASGAAEKAVPVVGWVILAAQLEHFASTIGPDVQKISYEANSAAASEVYTTYENLASEMKSGNVDAAEFSSFSRALGSNMDSASKDVSDGTSTPLYRSTIGAIGAPAGTNTTALGSLLEPVAAADSESADSLTGSKYKCNDGKGVPSGQEVCDEEMFNRGNATLNGISSALNVPGLNTVVNVILTIIHGPSELAGAVTGPVFNGVCKLTIGCQDAENAIAAKASELLDFIAKKAVVPAVSDVMSGGRIMDMIIAGADFTLNTSCQELLGCGHVTDVKASEVRDQYIADQKQSFNNEPMFARMFSTDTPYSLVSRLAMSVPGDKSTAGSQLALMIARNPFASFGRFASTLLSPQKATAGTLSKDPFGIPQNAYSSVPNDPEAFWTANCVTGPLAKYDASSDTIDVSDWLNTPGNVVQDSSTGTAEYTHDNPCMLLYASYQSGGGLSDSTILPKDSTTADANSGAITDADSITVASYNMCQEAQHGVSPGGCPIKLTEKSGLIADYINGTTTGTPFDIVGAQELSQGNLSNLMTKLSPNYASFPLQQDLPKAQGRAIIWNTQKFGATPASSGRIADIYSNDGSHITSPTDPYAFPWVELKTSDSQSVFVLSIHSPNNGAGNAGIRAHNAEQALQWAHDHATGNNIVIITGDFNRSGPDDDGQDSHYCILTADGLLEHAHDMSDGTPASPDNPAHCPDKQKDGAPLDSIYVSTNAQLTAKDKSWTWLGEGHKIGSPSFNVAQKTGTDHSPSYVTIERPGSASSGDTASGGLAWPVDKSLYTSNQTLFLKPHAGAGTFTSPNTDNVADDISLSKGTPVYALAGGKVIKRPLGRSSRICVGDPNSDNNGGLEIQSQVQGGTLLVAYAHGDSVTTKDTVNSGEQIMDVGQVGNSCGPHLHIDMSFNGKNVCPQDVFLALGNNQQPDFAALAAKAQAPCSRL